VAASVDTSLSPTGTSRSLIASVRSQTVAGIALDITGWWVVLLFHHIKFGGFLYLPLECRESDTSHTPITPRASPATTGNQKEQQIQDSSWSRVQKKDSYWSERQEYKLEIGQRQLKNC
jgi:hypothetical protein